jgi:O-antigen/teichoic acid export membrane protein
VALVALGFGVNGAVLALTLSFIATWLVARTVRGSLIHGAALPAAEVKAATVYAGPVAIALLGQILINNSDVLLVKHYFEPALAGQYAALALIGRHEQGLPHRHLLWASLGLVGAASVAVVGACYFWGDQVMALLFGAAYLPVAPLLWLYALATTLYALANVFITYGLSLGHRTGSWLALGAGVVQVGVLIAFHGSLATVVLVQVGVMLALVAVLWVVAVARRGD